MIPLFVLLSFFLNFSYFFFQTMDGNELQYNCNNLEKLLLKTLKEFRFENCNNNTKCNTADTLKQCEFSCYIAKLLKWNQPFFLYHLKFIHGFYYYIMVVKHLKIMNEQYLSTNCYQMTVTAVVR
jgi:hypothetical protein